MKNILLATSLLALSANAQSVDRLLQDVLETNPTVTERLHNFKASQSDITAAQAGYYPSLDLSFGAGKEETDRTPTGGVTATTDFDITQTSITYSQNLFKGFETLHQVDEQSARSVAAAYSYIETVNDIGLDLVSSYVEVLRTNELLTTARQNVEINEEIFNKVSKLFESGLTTLSEVNKIESSLSLAKSNTIVNENNLASTRYALKRIVGHDVDVAAMVKPLFETQLPATKEAAMEFALQNNPSLLVSDYNVQQAQAAKKVKEAAYYPELDVEVSQSESEHLSAYDGEEEKFKAMAYLSFNLFNGFADQAAIEKNAALALQEQAKRDQLRREVTESLDLAWSSYEKLSEQLRHLNDYKEFSLKTLTLYSKEYDLGRRSLLDLLAAQSDYIGSKSQIIGTEYDILLAKYRILDAMGIIVTSILEGGDSLYQGVGVNAPLKP